jgi:hypothetical protein
MLLWLWLESTQLVCCTEPRLTEALYILFIPDIKIQLYISVHSDNGQILSTMTDKLQTRPLVREGAPHGQDSNFHLKRNIWSWAPAWALHQDRQTDWPSVAMWLWLCLWLWVNATVNMHPQQWEAVFSVGSVQRSNLKNYRRYDSRLSSEFVLEAE